METMKDRLRENACERKGGLDSNLLLLQMKTTSPFVSDARLIANWNRRDVFPLIPFMKGNAYLCEHRESRAGVRFLKKEKGVERKWGNRGRPGRRTGEEGNGRYGFGSPALPWPGREEAFQHLRVYKPRRSRARRNAPPAGARLRGLDNNSFGSSWCAY